jgi:sensor domain CHASE-containing protein
MHNQDISEIKKIVLIIQNQVTSLHGEVQSIKMNMATKQELNEVRNTLRSEFKSDINSLRKSFENFVDKDFPFALTEVLSCVGAVKVELEKKIDSVRSELKNEINGVRDELKNEIVVLRKDVNVALSYRELVENHESRIKRVEEVTL